MDISTGKPAGPQRLWAAVMGSLSALFMLRVVGQVVQRWLPQPWLPPFASWQGSVMPYSLLIAIQFVILGAMACASYGAWKATMVPSHQAMQWTAWLGGVYMAASLARLAVGYKMEGAPAWFSARISGVSHLVLAGFVLALSRYHSLWEPARGGAAQ
jgi:hypothetical protein